jgi:hypothetical protein
MTNGTSKLTDEVRASKLSIKLLVAALIILLSNQYCQRATCPEDSPHPALVVIPYPNGDSPASVASEHNAPLMARRDRVLLDHTTK